MANRAYLYSCAVDPAVDADTPLRGIAEFAYDIPMIFRLLLSEQTRKIPSRIWEDRIALVGTWDGAVERTLAVLDLVAAGEVHERAAFEHELAAVRTALAPERRGQFLVLEVVEILALDEDPERELDDLIRLQPAIAELAQRAIDGLEDEWLANLRASWAEQLCGGNWSEVLYFNFGTATPRYEVDVDVALLTAEGLVIAIPLCTPLTGLYSGAHGRASDGYFDLHIVAVAGGTMTTMVRERIAPATAAKVHVCITIVGNGATRVEAYDNDLDGRELGHWENMTVPVRGHTAS
jgi:hypothetical protein